MNEKRILLTGIAVAVLLAGAVSATTGSTALLAATPTGAAIYLVVGVAVPQLLLGRRTGDQTRIALALLASVAGGVVFVIGEFTRTTLAGARFVDVLAILVVGVLLGTAVREFRRGYAEARARNG